jgi:hypothetical protein
MNEPGIYTYTAYRNDSFQDVITIVDSANNPISLANADVKLQVRTKPDGDIKITISEGNGLSVGGAGSNVITINKVLDIDKGGRYFYDLQATFTNGQIQTYMRGPFIVIEDITK